MDIKGVLPMCDIAVEAQYSPNHMGRVRKIGE